MYGKGNQKYFPVQIKNRLCILIHFLIGLNIIYSMIKIEKNSEKKSSSFYTLY